MASRLFLLPLVPALAFGIVEVASRISMPTAAPTPTTIKAPAVVIIEHAAPVAPIAPVVIEEPPAPVLQPECRGCATSD